MMRTCTASPAATKLKGFASGLISKAAENPPATGKTEAPMDGDNDVANAGG